MIPKSSKGWLRFRHWNRLVERVGAFYWLTKNSKNVGWKDDKWIPCYSKHCRYWINLPNNIWDWILVQKIESATADTNASWHVCCPSLYRGLGEARRSEGCWVVVIASLLRYPLHPPHGSCFLFLDSQLPQILGLFVGMLVGAENS